MHWTKKTPDEAIKKHYTVYDPAISPEGVKLYPHSVKAYDLDWAVLRDWLRKKFKDNPAVKIPETNHGLQDKYNFSIPRELTTKEKREIEAMRKPDPAKSAKKTHSEYTPDKKPNWDF